jgi:hypothetical protein
MTLLKRMDEVDYSQLRKSEYIQLFLNHCRGDFELLREYVRSVPEWKDAFQQLESNEGLAWKLIFYLLASGRLLDNEKEIKLDLTPEMLLKQFKPLFAEVD